jgi:hypothetical protein
MCCSIDNTNLNLDPQIHNLEYENLVLGQKNLSQVFDLQAFSPLSQQRGFR